MDHQVRITTLQSREIDKWFRVFAESVIFTVSRQADDLVKRGWTIEVELTKSPAHGISIIPKKPRCCFVDDSHAGCFLIVLVSELPPTHDRNSQCRKVAGTDIVELDGLLKTIRRIATFKRYQQTHPIKTQRNDLRCARRRYLG